MGKCKSYKHMERNQFWRLRKEHKGWPKGKFMTPRKNIICKNCGNKKEVKISSSQEFCCIKCRNIWFGNNTDNWQKKLGDNHPKVIEYKKRMSELQIGENNNAKQIGARKKISIFMQGRYVGKKNPRWIDGRSNEPYPNEFRKKRQRIIERDNNTCQLCSDMILNQTRKKHLDVHHIDYNKKNNNEDNLITLCHFCNVSVNTDRKQWTNFFQNKIGEIIK